MLEKTKFSALPRQGRRDKYWKTSLPHHSQRLQTSRASQHLYDLHCKAQPQWLLSINLHVLLEAQLPRHVQHASIVHRMLCNNAQTTLSSSAPFTAAQYTGTPAKERITKKPPTAHTLTLSTPDVLPCNGTLHDQHTLHSCAYAATSLPDTPPQPTAAAVCMPL